MKSLLDRVTPGDVVTEPFPHVVVRDAAEPALFAELLAQYPSQDTLAEHAPVGSNQAFYYRAARALQDPDVPPLWKEFIRRHSSAAFVQEMFALFAGHLPPRVQELADRQPPLRVGVRDVDSFPDVDLVIDTQIGLNTPVTDTPSSVKGPHVDRPHAVFSGLYYLRSPDDDSTGGELELYRLTTDGPGVFGPDRSVSFANVERVKTIPYESNVLVLFPNSRLALHGVTPRDVTPWPRRVVNLTAEVRKALFLTDPSGQAARPAPPVPARLVGRLKRALRTNR